MSTGLTLYDIETDLLNLMLCREALLNDPDRSSVLEDGETRESELALIDQAIQERVSAEIAKVDGIAFYLREFAARAATAKVEKDRLAARQRMWEAREERLKELVTSVMLMTGKKRLEGDSNTLRLQKCPPSVEVNQSELLPDEYQRVRVTMSVRLWEAIKRCRWVDSITEMPREILECNVGPAEPSKSKIAEALKQQIPCDKCKGGFHETTDHNLLPCETCHGTGKVNQGVPGCSLVTDKMSLRVE